MTYVSHLGDVAMRWMGIDGGGTSLRVVIVDDDLNELASATSDSVNPNAVGHEKAQYLIRHHVEMVLQRAGLRDVDGAAIGIAGASDRHSANWLLETLRPVLPAAPIVPSSDVEIALVGGRGRLDGILLLAGTGSVALGINADGQQKRIGGWGYLLGDEGSGYWIGTRALQTLTRWHDGVLETDSQLPQAIMRHLNLELPFDIINWRYQQATQSDVAELAQLIDASGLDGDVLATAIIAKAADYLANMARQLLKTLNLGADSIVFAGSLLTNKTLLQEQVCRKLNLSEPPVPLHSPAVGAALLAKTKAKFDAD